MRAAGTRHGEKYLNLYPRKNSWDLEDSEIGA